MKKKSLLTLLVLPLILSGCGTKEPEKPHSGERGEDVLTAAQKERMLTLDSVQDYDLLVKSTSGKVIENEYGLEWSNSYFAIYRHDGGVGHPTSWIIASKVKGESIDVATKGAGYEGPSYLNRVTGSISDGTTNIPYLYYYAHFETGGGYENNYNDVKDVFGNTLFHSNKEYDDQHFNSASLSRDDNDNYIVTVNYYDEGVYASKRLVYGEGFKSLTKEETDPYNTITKSQEYTFTDGGLKYTVGLTNGKEYFVSYDEGGQTITKYYSEYQQGYKVLIGKYLIYQVSSGANVHEGDYDVLYYDEAIKLNTYRLNLATGETEKLAFPYVIRSISHDDFIPEDLEENESYEIPNYAVARVYPIVNKQFKQVEETYVVDADLVLHDDLTAYETNYRKLGENHYIINKVIYDKNYKVVGDLSRYDVITVYPKGVLVRETASGSNRYGFVGEDGTFVLEPQYQSANPGYNPPTIDGYLKLKKDTGEAVYFDPYGLRLLTFTKEADREYVYNSSAPEFYCLRGLEDEETPGKFDDDAFYFLNVKLGAVTHFTSGISWNTFSFRQNNSTYTYRAAQYEDADGDIVLLSFVSSMVAIEE